MNNLRTKSSAELMDMNISRCESSRVVYKTASVDGLKIFYREAGPKQGPNVVLLHGFPSSSHMFRELIPLLADKYHVIAPDYPGYGYSDAPPADQFSYTFDHLAEVIDHFLDQQNITRYSIYIQDYGSPVGFRLATWHPERIQAIITQNGNAYDEGLAPFWAEYLYPYWKARNPETEAKVRKLRTISLAPRFPCCYIYTPSMLASTPNRFRHTLEKLAAEPPSTKTALIRSILSEIEGVLASGKTWKQVWQCLADDGLDISYETFRKLLQRVRKQARISAPPRGKSLELPGVCGQETADSVARDPLANLKRLEENRPGFHWRATPNLRGSDNGR